MRITPLPIQQTGETAALSEAKDVGVMPWEDLPSIGVLGTGSYVPERVLDNDALAASLGVDQRWIVNKTGIRQRRIAAAHEATSDLATRAAQRALAAAGVHPRELDLIVVATSSPDWVQPATACAVQANLGATRAAAVDMNAVCAGFVYALALTSSTMRGDSAYHLALVIGADIYSRVLDYQDRRTSILFGDGAGAAVLGRVPAGEGILASSLHADGARVHCVQIPAGGSRKPATAETVVAGEHFFRMDGRSVRDFVMETFPDIVRCVLDRAGHQLHDVDLIIPHQANLELLEACRRQLSLPRERLHYTVERYGNTGAGSIPITLDDAVRSGRVRTGALILFVGFGGGLTWGGLLLRWTAGPSAHAHPPSASAGNACSA
jgi:3-oxoacyl-(acyl-carrier-protein) synthase III